MGQMSFFVPQPARLLPEAKDCAYLAGMDGIPWEGRLRWDQELLKIERDGRESGNLHFLWNDAKYGELVLCTGSLMERAGPYHLPVELARGTLNRLRNQAAAWEQAGMVLPQAFFPMLRQAGHLFAQAATGQDQPVAAAEFAEQAIQKGLDAIYLLSADYVRQVLEIRRSQQPQLSTLLAGRLDDVPQGAAEEAFLAAFNTALLSPNWRDCAPIAGEHKWELLDRQVQWCRDHGLRICMGPLVQLDRNRLPDWLYLWEDEYEEVESHMLDFADAVVDRYRGRVHLWICSGRMNIPGALALSEEQRLKMTVDLLEMTRDLDARTPAIASFDQPWAEYIAAQDQELTPLNFADTLVRSELGLAGVGLEMNLGYWPDGTLPRDPIEISRLIDRWGVLQIPVVAIITAPSGSAPDAKAAHAARPMAGKAVGGISPATQRTLVEWLLPLLIAKQPVQAVIWNQWSDASEHDFPHGGLVDAQGRPKPALQAIIAVRKQLLS